MMVLNMVLNKQQWIGHNRCVDLGLPSACSMLVPMCAIAVRARPSLAPDLVWICVRIAWHGVV
jgi:hypothetical protein